MSTDNPTRGFRTISEFRLAEPELSDEQAEAIWEFFPRELKVADRDSVEQAPFRAPAPGLKEVLLSPIGKALFGTTVLLVVALLFPPFYVQLPEGMSMNSGFHFLFSPPKQGQLIARVDVALLLIELSVIGACGAAGVFVASKLGKQ